MFRRNYAPHTCYCIVRQTLVNRADVVSFMFARLLCSAGLCIQVKTPPREGGHSSDAARFPSPPSLSLLNDTTNTTRQSQVASSTDAETGSLLQEDAKPSAPSQRVDTSEYNASSRSSGATPSAMNQSLNTSVFVDHEHQSARVTDFLSRSSIDNFGALPRAAAAPHRAAEERPVPVGDESGATIGATPPDSMNQSLDTSMFDDHRRQSARVADFLSRSLIDNFGALPGEAAAPPSTDKREEWSTHYTDEERPKPVEEESGAKAETVADLWSRSMVEQFGPLPDALAPVPAADKHEERSTSNVGEEVSGADAATVADLWSRSMIEHFGPLPAPAPTTVRCRKGDFYGSHSLYNVPTRCVRKSTWRTCSPDVMFRLA